MTTGLKRRKGAQGQHLSSDHLTHPTQTQRQSFVWRAPGCQLLVKWKSQEEEGWLKPREVLTQAAHPLKKRNKIMGRVLTLFLRLVFSVLKPCELLSMKDLLHVLARWKQSCRAPRKGEKAFWLELQFGGNISTYTTPCNFACSKGTGATHTGNEVHQRPDSFLALQREGQEGRYM